MFIARPAFAQAAPIRNPMKPPKPVEHGICARTWQGWPWWCTKPVGHGGECKRKPALRLRNP